MVACSAARSNREGAGSLTQQGEGKPRKVDLPTVAQVRGVGWTYARGEFWRATVDNLRLNPERRLVDQTGIEPVTS